MADTFFSTNRRNEKHFSGVSVVRRWTGGLLIARCLLLSGVALSAGGLDAEAVNTGAEQKVLEQSAISRRIAGAELVARVKITGVHRIIDSALSEPGMIAILGYIYSGVAEKAWKGAPANLIAFRLTLDDCADKLKHGERYLIFAEADTQGRLQLSGCEAAVVASDADKLLVQLNQYKRG